MKLKALAFTAVLVCAPTLAFAHTVKTGEHGGPQTDAGGFQVEVVAKDKTLDAYLLDNASKPVNSAGVKGVAIFKAADGKPVRISLEPAGDNKLSGVAPSLLPAQLDGAVQLTTQTGGSVQGKFAAHDHDREHEAGHGHDH
jgi:hypothetical protein